MTKAIIITLHALGILVSICAIAKCAKEGNGFGALGFTSAALWCVNSLISTIRE